MKGLTDQDIFLLANAAKLVSRLLLEKQIDADDDLGWANGFINLTTGESGDEQLYLTCPKPTGKTFEELTNKLVKYFDEGEDA